MMNKTKLQFYTQYLPVTNTINIYQDITSSNNPNKSLELKWIISAKNNFHDMADKEFVNKIINKFKEELLTQIREESYLLEEDVFITFSKFPDATPEYILNNINQSINTDWEA